MTNAFPKLPGYVVTHNPMNVDHKKVTHNKLEHFRNFRNEIVPLYPLPEPIDRHFLPEKRPEDMSMSHTQYPNHTNGGKELTEMFEPTATKLDKQVSKARLPILPWCQLFNSLKL